MYQSYARLMSGSYKVLTGVVEVLNNHNVAPDQLRATLVPIVRAWVYWKRALQRKAGPGGNQSKVTTTINDYQAEEMLGEPFNINP